MTLPPETGWAHASGHSHHLANGPDVAGAARGPMFRVEGAERLFTLREMQIANLGDTYVCEWCESAEVGDVLDEMHSARVERVS